VGWHVTGLVFAVNPGVRFAVIDGAVFWGWWGGGLGWGGRGGWLGGRGDVAGGAVTEEDKEQNWND